MHYGETEERCPNFERARREELARRKLDRGGAAPGKITSIPAVGYIFRGVADQQTPSASGVAGLSES